MALSSVKMGEERRTLIIQDAPSKRRGAAMMTRVPPLDGVEAD
jgi:hypothetical protein